MSWRESQDNDFDIQINHDEDYQPPRKIGTFLRNNRLAFFILVNTISISIMIFFLSGGHPLERFKSVKNNVSSVVENVQAQPEPRKSLRELQLEDRAAVKTVVSKMMGENIEFTLFPYSSADVDMMKRKHPVLTNSRGNLFTRIEGIYYYLSKDGQRLYYCSIKGHEFNEYKNKEAVVQRPREARKDNSVTIYSPSPVSGEPLKTDEQFYKDENGVWRNY